MAESAKPSVLRPSEIPAYRRGYGAKTIRLVTRKLGSRHFINGITVFEPGAAMPLHTHNCDESVLLLEGWPQPTRVAMWSTRRSLPGVFTGSCGTVPGRCQGFVSLHFGRSFKCSVHPERHFFHGPWLQTACPTPRPRRDRENRGPPPGRNVAQMKIEKATITRESCRHVRSGALRGYLTGARLVRVLNCFLENGEILLRKARLRPVACQNDGDLQELPRQ